MRNAYYGLTVDHARSSLEEEAEESVEEGKELAFDDYSESDDDYITDITSRGTVFPPILSLSLPPRVLLKIDFANR